MIEAWRWRGGLGLGLRAAESLLRIGVDSVEERLGRALPRTREDFADVDVVNALLEAHVPAGGDALPPVESVRLPGVDFESSNCENFLVELGFGDETKARTRSPLP